MIALHLIPQPLQDTIVHWVELKSLVKEQPKDDKQVQDTAFKVFIAARNLFCAMLLWGTYSLPTPLFWSIGILATLINEQPPLGTISLSTSALAIATLVESVKKRSFAFLIISLCFSATSYLSGRYYQRQVQKFLNDSQTVETFQYELRGTTNRIINWAT